MRSLDVLGEKSNSWGWRRARLIKDEVIDESSPTMILTPTSGTCFWKFFVLLNCRGKRACVIFSYYLANLCAVVSAVAAAATFSPLV